MSLLRLRVKGGNQGMTQHSQLVTKAINARNHGAKALVLVNGKLGDGEEDLLTRFGSVSGPEECRHHFCSGQERRGRWMAQGGGQIAGRVAGAD
jgi:hypothetical protein